jgi:hypothetical protein
MTVDIPDWLKKIQDTAQQPTPQVQESIATGAIQTPPSLSYATEFPTEAPKGRSGLSRSQILMLAMLLLFNILILGCFFLLFTGRIAF